MPAVAVCTVDKISTGHGCSAIAGIKGALQDKVTIGGKPVAIVGDAIAPHTIPAGPICVAHSSVINAGSSKISIGGIPVARIGDSADAGAVISGSSKIFGGGPAAAVAQTLNVIIDENGASTPTSSTPI